MLLLFFTWLLILAAQISTKKPCFVVPLSDVMIKAGQKVKLECEVGGSPIPKLIWTHDGKVIEETKYYKVGRVSFFSYF